MRPPDGGARRAAAGLAAGAAAKFAAGLAFAVGFALAAGLAFAGPGAETPVPGGQAGERAGERTDGSTSGQTDQRAGGQANGRTSERGNEGAGRRTDGRADGGTAAPRRIVSLDYCADQFVLGLAGRDRILAVSPDAEAEFSYLRAAAAGLPTVRPRAEDVLILRPDLVARSYGGGPNARAFFERAGVPVLQIGFAGDLDGVRASIRGAAKALGAPARGEALIADMDARIARARGAAAGNAARANVLYLTPSGITAGPGTLVHRMIEAAGLDNFQSRSGWGPIPLERLAYESPDLIASAWFGARTDHDDAWTPSRHPVAKRHLRSVPVVSLEGSTTSCGGWFLADAVEALAAAGRESGARKQARR